jgi:hypothetical protein
MLVSSKAVGTIHLSYQFVTFPMFLTSYDSKGKWASFN